MQGHFSIWKSKLLPYKWVRKLYDDMNRGKKPLEKIPQPFMSKIQLGIEENFLNFIKNIYI